MCIFYNAGVSKEHFYLGPNIILFTEDTKMWMIHLYIYRKYVYFTTKKNCKVMFWNKTLNCALFAVSQ